MLNKKVILILAGFAIALFIAAMLIKPKEQSVASKQTGQAFFKDLMNQINDITKIHVASKDASFEILLNDEKKWVIKEKNNYPAAFENISKLLVGTAKLKKIEPKTSNPDKLVKLGLADVGAEESDSTAVTLYKGETKVAEYILGHRKPGAKEEMYIRGKDDNQSWLVSGYVSINKSADDWLNKSIVDIDQRRVSKVIVKPKDSEAFTVYKEKYDSKDYKLADLPKGKEIESAYTVNNIANSMAKLKLRDIGSDYKKEDLQKNMNYSVVVETFDGLRFSMDVAKIDDKFIATLDSSFDESIVNLPAETKTPGAEANGSDKKEAEAKEKTPEELAKEKQLAEAEQQALEAERQKKIQQAKDEAVKYAETWSKWIYVLPDQSAAAIGKHKKDLYKKDVKKEKK